MTSEYSMENGYYVIYSQNVAKGSTNAFLAVRASERINEISQTLEQIKGQYNDQFSYDFLYNGISIEINTIDENQVKVIVSDITKKFELEGYRQACMLSGAESNLALYQSGTGKIVAEEAAVENHVKTANQTAEKKINPLTGLIGGIIGVLLGMVVWVLVARLGWFSAWLGVLVMFLGLSGFRLLGRGINKGWGFLVLVLGILSIVAAQFISFGWAIYDLYLEEGVKLLFSEILEAIPLYLEIAEVKGAFIKDLLLGLVLGGIGMIPMMAKIVPTQKERSEKLQYTKIG